MAKTWALAEYHEGDMYVSLHSTYRACLISLANDWLDGYENDDGEYFSEDWTDSQIHSGLENYREELSWIACELAVPEPDESAVWNSLGRVEALVQKWESSGDSASMAHALVLKAVLKGAPDGVAIPDMTEEEAKGFMLALQDLHSPS